MTITSTIRHRTSPESAEMIFSFLRNHPQGALATMTQYGTLQASMINVYALDNYCFAFMTKKNTRKYKNLLHVPTVAYLAFDDFGKTEVEVEGIAEMITNEAQQEEIMTQITDDIEKGRRHRSPFIRPSDDHVLFMIYPRKIHMTMYMEQDAGSNQFHEALEFDVTMRS